MNTQVEHRGLHHLSFNPVDLGGTVKRAFNRAPRCLRVKLTEFLHRGASLIP